MDFSKYKGIYVVATSVNGEFPKVVGELIGEAKKIADKLNDQVNVLFIGNKVKIHAETLIHLGADNVYLVEYELFNYYNGKVYEKILVDFFKEHFPSVIIFPSTDDGRDLAPRMASKLVCGVTADVTEISVDEKTGMVIWSRPAMGGNIMADIVSPNFRPQIGTVRPGNFLYPNEDTTRHGKIINIEFSLKENEIGTLLKDIITNSIEDNPVEDAKIIVAGGRGIGKKENWKYVSELAKLLNAAIGCSRPVCEMGWETSEHQIGQTGKNVSPKVYIALGISGAMQHICGVKSDILIAINKDSTAPIMKEADYTVVADLNKFLPILIKELKKIKTDK